MADNSKNAALRVEVSQLFSDIETTIAEAKPDLEKFAIKENAAAGTRLRKAMQVVKDKAQEVRLKTQEAKNLGE